MQMEHCDYGPLSKALEEGFFSAASKSEAYFSMRACIRTAKEIACGLDFLHSLDIVHGEFLSQGYVLGYYILSFWVALLTRLPPFELCF